MRSLQTLQHFSSTKNWCVGARHLRSNFSSQGSDDAHLKTPVSTADLALFSAEIKCAAYCWPSSGRWQTVSHQVLSDA